MNVQIPVKWLQELLALCGPEDHELRERVMVSITAMDEQAAAPVVLPEPEAVISEVMGLVDEWGMESHLRGEAELDAQHSEATQEEIDCAKDRASKERAAWKAIESKLRALLATGGEAQAQQPAIMPKGESAAAQLRAMATNYPTGHSWDKLDAKACIRGALEIEALRALLATATGLPAQAVEPSDAELIALNAGECFFSESPSKYPELGHGTQFHGGAPGVIGFARAALALRTDPAAYSQKFQQRVQPWMMACFGPEISADSRERNHRFLEEALELVQCLGCTASEAHQLVDYVYSRPWGEPAQEAGGVMVTLAALCLANGLDMHACGETELARIWTKLEAIRAKQAAKPKHSPLPMQAHQTQDALRLAFVLSEIRRDGMDALTAALHDLDGFPLDHQASIEAIDRAAIAAAKGE